MKRALDKRLRERRATDGSVGCRAAKKSVASCTSFAATLRAIMKRRHIRQVDLEGDLITKSYISKLINGIIKEPTWPRACAIIDALEMSLDEFRALELQHLSARRSRPDTANR